MRLLRRGKEECTAEKVQTSNYRHLQQEKYKNERLDSRHKATGHSLGWPQSKRRLGDDPLQRDR